MDDEFYEDDEPIEKVRADYDAGDKGLTVSGRDRSRRTDAIEVGSGTSGFVIEGSAVALQRQFVRRDELSVSPG